MILEFLGSILYACWLLLGIVVVLGLVVFLVISLGMLALMMTNEARRQWADLCGRHRNDRLDIPQQFRR